jgi:hypothetical protein
MAKRRRSVKSKSRKSRRRRRNGAGMGRTAFLALMAKGKARKAGKSGKRRKSSKRRATKATKRRARSVAGKRIRPVILSRGGKYYRPRRSKYFKTARRVNGRRRRSNGAAGKLLSTVKGMFKVPSLLRYASIGGGIFGGTLLSKMLNTGIVPFTSMALPASVTSALAKARPAHGLIHILAGTIIASKARNKHIKDAALGLAALGSFDLLMQVLALAGMKNLPTFSGMNIDLRGMTQYGMTYPGAVYGVPKQAGMNVDLRGRRTRAMAGMNVDLLGEARARDAENSHLADNINDMIS